MYLGSPKYFLLIMTYQGWGYYKDINKIYHYKNRCYTFQYSYIFVNATFLFHILNIVFPQETMYVFEYKMWLGSINMVKSNHILWTTNVNTLEYKRAAYVIQAVIRIQNQIWQIQKKINNSTHFYNNQVRPVQLEFGII